MKIDNLRALEQLMKLCRKQGIEAIEIDNIKFNLGALPRPVSRARNPIEHDIPSEADIKIPQYNPIVADTIKNDGLTEDELLFYSARGDEQ